MLNTRAAAAHCNCCCRSSRVLQLPSLPASRLACSPRICKKFRFGFRFLRHSGGETIVAAKLATPQHTHTHTLSLPLPDTRSQAPRTHMSQSAYENCMARLMSMLRICRGVRVCSGSKWPESPVLGRRGRTDRETSDPPAGPQGHISAFAWNFNKAETIFFFYVCFFIFLLFFWYFSTPCLFILL